MTPEDFTRHVLPWVDARWGLTGPWRPERAARWIDDLSEVPTWAVMDALQEVFQAGAARAPAPSVLLEHSLNLWRRVATERPVAACAKTKHVWAILSDDGETREVLCARCRTEAVLPAAEALTESEQSEGAWRPALPAGPDPWANRRDLQ